MFCKRSTTNQEIRFPRIVCFKLLCLSNQRYPPPCAFVLSNALNIPGSPPPSPQLLEFIVSVFLRVFQLNAAGGVAASSASSSWASVAAPGALVRLRGAVPASPKGDRVVQPHRAVCHQAGQARGVPGAPHGSAGSACRRSVRDGQTD